MWSCPEVDDLEVCGVSVAGEEVVDVVGGGLAPGTEVWCVLVYLWEIIVEEAAVASSVLTFLLSRYFPRVDWWRKGVDEIVRGGVVYRFSDGLCVNFFDAPIVIFFGGEWFAILSFDLRSMLWDDCPFHYSWFWWCSEESVTRVDRQVACCDVLLVGHHAMFTYGHDHAFWVEMVDCWHAETARGYSESLALDGLETWPVGVLDDRWPDGAGLLKDWPHYWLVG